MAVGQDLDSRSLHDGWLRLSGKRRSVPIPRREENRLTPDTRVQPRRHRPRPWQRYWPLDRVLRPSVRPCGSGRGEPATVQYPGGALPFTLEYHLSIPEGNDGKMPRGRRMPWTLSSQKHLWQSLKRLSALGDKAISFLRLGVRLVLICPRETLPGNLRVRTVLG